jgi:hypothetical protein
MNPLINVTAKWQEDLIGFCETCFKVKLTSQQKNACREIVKVVKSKRALSSIVQREQERFERAGATPVDAMKGAYELAKKLIGKEVFGYALKLGVSIRSGTGCGKGGLGSFVILWWMTCFEESKTRCTAPTAHQLKSQLWSELYKWVNKRDDAGNYVFPYREHIVLEAERVYLKESGGGENFADQKTANVKDDASEQVETLAGVHSPYLLLLADEASGISDPVFRPLEGTMTGFCNWALLFWNPTRREGYAYRSHFKKEREQWICLHWDAEDSELVSRSQIEQLEKQHGRESSFFKIRVKGIPPSAEDGTLIPYEWVETAVGRELPSSPHAPVIMGVDVGGDGEGADKSSIYVRRGQQGLTIKVYSRLERMELRGNIIHECGKYKPDSVLIDENGIGWGLSSEIGDFYSRAMGVKTQRQAMNTDKFHNLRAELWWRTRELFEKGDISIPNDEDLISQLSSIKYFVNARGKIQIESKDEFRSRMKHTSPDKADALVISQYLQDKMFESVRERDAYDEERYRRLAGGEERGWMTS